MEIQDYLKALKNPFFLLLIHIILAYVLSMSMYAGVTTHEETLAKTGSVVLLSIGLSIFSFAISFYAGWTIVKKFQGLVKHAVFIGLMVGGIKVILSLANTVLMYFTLEGYKAAFAPVEGVGSLGIMIAVIAIIVGIPFSLAIDLGIAALGGFVAKEKKKEHQAY